MAVLFDFSQLPAPKVLESIDFETLLTERKAKFIALFPTDKRTEIEKTLTFESEPIVKLLQEGTYLEMQLRQRINEAALACMLAHATGTDLDNLGANYDTPRLVIQNADDTVVPAIEEILEPDSDYRYRIQLAFDRLSVAGPRSSYEYFARAADGRVADVSAFSPAPAHVTISILSREKDGKASAELLKTVERALNDENVRPVADRVTVQSASPVAYQIKATLYYFHGPEKEPIRQAAEKQLQEYTEQQRRLGRNINRSAIMASLHVEGVQRVELIEPAKDIDITLTQFGYCQRNVIASGGYDE